MPNDRTNPARRRALGTTVIACALVAVALGAPTGVLTLLDDGHPPTTDHQMPESLSEDRDSVAAPQNGATPEAGPSDGGRWGAAPERPTSGGLRVEELRGGWRVQAGAEEAAALGVVEPEARARRVADHDDLQRRRRPLDVEVERERRDRARLLPHVPHATDGERRDDRERRADTTDERRTREAPPPTSGTVRRRGRLQHAVRRPLACSLRHARSSMCAPAQLP